MYNPQLTAFVCAADCGSFTKAAEKLYLSPTAVMKQVNALEAHLQMQLISRTNQGIRLTPAGESVYADAKYLIDYSARAIRRAQQRMSDYEKTFCVGTSILNPCKPFVDLWGKVSDHFPEYRLNIVPFEDEHTTILQEISALGKSLTFWWGSAILQSGCCTVIFCSWVHTGNALPSVPDTRWRKRKSCKSPTCTGRI